MAYEDVEKRGKTPKEILTAKMSKDKSVNTNTNFR